MLGISIHTCTVVITRELLRAELVVLVPAVLLVADLPSFINVLIAEAALVVLHLFLVLLTSETIVVRLFFTVLAGVLLAVGTEDPVLAQVLAVLLLQLLSVGLPVVVVDLLFFFDLEHVSASTFKEAQISELLQDMNPVDLEIFLLAVVVLDFRFHEASSAAFHGTADIWVLEDVVEGVALGANFMHALLEDVSHREEAPLIVVFPALDAGKGSVLYLGLKLFFLGFCLRLLHFHELLGLLRNFLWLSSGFHFFVRLLLLGNLLGGFPRLLGLLELLLEEKCGELHVLISLHFSLLGDLLDSLEKE